MSALRIVIIGGGPGGYEAALVAVELGADVTIVSTEGLGGNSVLWDCVPSKGMIVSAEAVGWMDVAGNLGVEVGTAGDVGTDARVDMGAVMDHVRDLGRSQSRDVERKVAAAGVTLVRGAGRLADPHTVQVTAPDGPDQTLTADIVLLATGSNPRVLPFSEPDGLRVFTSRELFALREVPRRLIVVGSGATGAEYAHAFARFGADVHLVSSRDQILPSEDPDAAAVIEDVFERRGMTIHRRRRAMDMERSEDGVRVLTRGPDGQEEWVEGSHALYCIGQVPSADALGLDEIGVQTSEAGAVEVDRVSRTNLHSVYAAGDVTGGVMLASVAAMQGRNAMWHALGSAVSPFRSDAIAACIFTDPEVATVGISAGQAANGTLPVRTISLPFTGNPRAKMAQTTDGFVKVHALEGSGTVLGGVVVAARASELVTPISVAVQNRLTVDQLAQSFSIYPSMTGSVMETARMLMRAPG